MLHEPRRRRSWLIFDVGQEHRSPMKQPYVTLIGLSLLLFTGCATLGLSNAPFSKPQGRFEGADSIVVESVSASSLPLQEGDRVVVRGRYSLQTRSNAMLALFLTPDRTTERFPATRKQQADAQFRKTRDISVGSGTFELECMANGGGVFQVSLIGTQSRDTFGSAIFTLEAPLSK